MSGKDENAIHLDIPPDELIEFLIHPDFQEIREKAMGSLEASVEEKSRTDDRLAFDVHTLDYARGITGVDRSKTEKNRSAYEWDLKAKRATWTYHGSQGKMVRVWGGIRIEPEGDGSKLVNDFNVEVKIPLMGGKIEKLVLKEVSKSWPKYEKAIRDFSKPKA